jgi:hypothetical protein
MEKQEIIVNYKRSGVKTLNGFGVLFFVIGSLALLIAIIGLVFPLYEILFTLFFLIGIVLFFFGAVCIGLSCIARVALCKRETLCQQYDFKEYFNIEGTQHLKSVY